MKTNCHVYVCSNRHGHLKIGCSNNPERRVKLLGKGMTLLFQTDVLEHAQQVEYLAQRVMVLHARHLWGEWFNGTIDQAKEAIRCAIRQADGDELQLVGKLRRFPGWSDRQRGIKSGVEEARSLIIKDLRESYQRF